MTPCLLQHQGYMSQLSFRILKSYCKYSYSLPAAKSTVYSVMCPTVTAPHSSAYSFSVSLLSGFVVGSSLSAIFQAAAMCAWIGVIPVSPDVPSMIVPTAVHGQSLLVICLPPSIPHTLEYS